MSCPLPLDSTPARKHLLIKKVWMKTQEIFRSRKEKEHLAKINLLLRNLVLRDASELLYHGKDGSVSLIAFGHLGVQSWKGRIGGSNAQ